MNTEPYSFAQLEQEDVKRIQQLEESLAQSSGHPITLIAFESAQPAAKER